VEIDRATGRVEVVKLVAVDDCGVVVNPAIVAGQTLGSITQGLGQALYEELSYDPGGQPLFSSLLDYSIPTASEMPPVLKGESVTPNPNLELGIKGPGRRAALERPRQWSTRSWMRSVDSTEASTCRSHRRRCGAPSSPPPANTRPL